MTTYNALDMIRTSLFIIGLAISFTLEAQPYEHSLGVRAGYSSGITYKGFFRHRMAAIEGQLLYNRHGFNVSGIIEHHAELFRSQRLLAYLGGGAFGGNWDSEFSAGIAAIAGVEYTIRDVPLNFSIDWKPMMNIYRIFEVDFLDFGISIRYRFRL